MICLVDSSSWIEYFRGNSRYAFINSLIMTNNICTNEIILSELVPSIIHQKEKKLAELLNCLKKFPLLIDWQEICNIQLLNLKHGNNNIGIADLIIAQNCMQNGLALITEDKHFRTMAGYIPLEIYKEKNPGKQK